LEGGQSLKIYLDAGHGGTDGGAQGNGLSEKNLNLSLVKKIQAKLEKGYKNIQIMQTRTTDVFLTLSERTYRANAWGADFFISCHINASTSPTARGFASYIYTSTDDKTKAFQNVMHEEIVKAISANTGVVNLGKKQANFHVLRESHMTAILTENLFVSNTADSALLKQDSFLDRLADGHVLGLEKFIGLEKNIPPPLSEPKPLYQIIAGTFEDLENAEAFAEKLTKSGYKCYIDRK
jgi:N-acetylmuramoyl-L-alanine amidase